MRVIEAIYLPQVPLINSSPLSLESVNFIHACSKLGLTVLLSLALYGYFWDNVLHRHMHRQLTHVNRDINAHIKHHG